MNNFHDPSIHMLAQPSGVVIPHPASQVTEPEVVAEESSGVDGEKSLSHFINLAQGLNSQTMLHAISGKLFDHFTIWDLVIHYTLLPILSVIIPNNNFNYNNI
jgi:hypothetical protein